MRKGLAALAEGESWLIALGPQRYELRLRDRGLVVARVLEAAAFWADVRRAFLAEVVRTLGSAGERFRLCQRCRLPFIRRKRQRYCTPKYSQLARTHKYRRVHRERLQARRRNRF